jgi:hypothetical protein
MNMGVIHCPPGCVAVIDANIEPAHGSILSHYLGANLVQQLVDRASLRLEKIEESWSMSLGYNEGMECCHRILVMDRECEGVESKDSLFWHVTEDALCLTRVYAFADRSEINVITRTLISVAFEA